MANKIKGIKEYVREILKKPEPEETRFRYQDIPFFFRFIKPLWKLGALGLMLNAIAIALQSLLPLSSKVAIDFIVMKKGFQDVEDLLQSLHLNTLIPTMRHFLE